MSSVSKCPITKKNVHVFLTEQGRALHDKSVPLAEKVSDISVAGMSERDVKTARKLLPAVIEYLAEDELGSTDGADGCCRRGNLGGWWPGVAR